MSAERRGVVERMTRAFQSSDLSMDSDVRRDVDHLIALGVVDQHTGGAGGSVMRMHLAGSPADLRAARDSAIGVAKRLRARRGWELTGAEVKHVAELALAYYVFPACPHCAGRKFELVPGTPVLSAKECRECGGTGKRPLPRRFGKEIRDVLASLDHIEAITEHAVARRLR